MMKSFSMLVLLGVLSACSHAPTRETTPRAVYVDLMEQGKRLAAEGDYVRAEQYLAGALETGGDVDVVLPVLLKVCFASERFEAALAYAERFEPNARDSVELQLVLAALQMAVGQVDNARRTLELVLKLHDDARAHYLLGELFYNTLEDYGAADKHYRRYLALQPQGPHASNVRRLLLKAPTSRTTALNETSLHGGVSQPDETATDAVPVLVPMPEENLPDGSEEAAVKGGETP
jgi:tetratricopeptide (TPR) repeat protein